MIFEKWKLAEVFMKKRHSFRDFYYDHSDIVLAVLILCIAAVVIVWRINIIVDYPNTLQDISGVVQTTGQQEAADTAAKDDGKKGQQTAVIASWADDKLAEDFTVKVKGKKTAKRIACLVNAGLFTSDVDYQSVCEAAEVNSLDIKEGSFTFKAGTTKEDIVKEITNK